MSSANVNDRESIERLYPRQAFDEDAARNALPDAAVHSGVTIASAPDASGAFTLMRAQQHVGERDPEGDTIFLLAMSARSEQALAPSSGYGGTVETGNAPAEGRDEPDDYAAFIARIIEAARSATFKEPIGKDERLKGFHGG